MSAPTTPTSPSDGNEAALAAGHEVICRPSLRSVHPVAADGTTAIAFNRPDAPPLRLVLDTETAARLVNWLGTYLGVWSMGMKVQCSMSSGIRNGDGSPNDGQTVRPLAIS